MQSVAPLTAAVLAVLLIASTMGPAISRPVGSPAIVFSPPAPPERDMIGRAVYTADGNEVGRVDAVETDGNGAIASIDIAVLYRLARGPRVVRVPGSRIAAAGLEVRLAMSATELGFLPSIDGEPE
ncbi:MAG TPA: PRC-barrel domain-containing protein [Hyphomicrobiaceae bacterium]|nr:PRC-barrel domain-containing protein [Hyphomicrobiaceae bacterium]